MDSHDDPGGTRPVNLLQGVDNPDPLGGASPKRLLSGHLDKGNGTMLKRIPLLVKGGLGEDEALAIRKPTLTCV